MSTTSAAALHRLIVSVSSLPASLAFYADLLRLRVQNREGPVAWLQTGDGTVLMLHERPAVPSDAAVAPAFALAGMDAAVDRWAALGGAVIDPPAEQPWGERMAVVRDPDGHVVCLVEQR
ncbi:VOC family protein [Leifsonia aquatica]|uniref:VOC family protein n=1 Tax=Leifsonia aquatica TaxID=144185 RepID=UPI0004694EC5|nr:VOC family protein [Leifsonia aquatica]